MIVLVAAQDEAERIGATLAALRGSLPGASLWLADDGSRDGTAAIARAAGATVVGSGARQGKGAAMTLAAREALAHGLGAGGMPACEALVAGAANPESGPVVLLCDGDLGASAARLAPLVQAVLDGEADLAIAVFARPAGGGFGIVVRFARWAIRRCCGLHAKEPLCGQRALRASHLNGLLPLAAGYGMELGMTIDAVRGHLRVAEIELDLEHRATGRTPAGFAHRGRQLLDCVRAYRSRR